VLETVILSVLGIIGFAVIRVQFYIFLGILAGVANIIPYIGPVLGAMPACIIALIYPPFGGWSVPLVIALTFILQFIDNAIIMPIIVGKSVDLGPITTILVVLVGSQFFGLLGLLMAVPVAAMIKVTVQVIYKEIKGYPELG
jgi:predicted PurR-regulated permease PerM